MKKFLSVPLFLLLYNQCFCWGFFAHRKINYYAVFLLPPEMMVLYKPNIDFISEHAVDPDKRRYVTKEEAARHYLDIDHFGKYPFNELPRKWEEAAAKFSEDTLKKYGILPWWIEIMENRLTQAFKEKNKRLILKHSADIAHYVADAHVPLHVCSNHNGQFTGQQGIHAFWESRIPELLADNKWDFFIGKAAYLNSPAKFIWKRILESAAASDSSLSIEALLSAHYPVYRKYSFEERKGVIKKQYSTAYSIDYNNKLNGMIERRMRQSILAVASLWYTAWVNAGQPDLSKLTGNSYNEDDLKEFELLNSAWLNNTPQGREHE